MSRKIYRWLENGRFDSQELFAGLYEIGQGVVAEEQPAYLVVAVAPVNFEKPYAKAVEEVSVVYKATPPALEAYLEPVWAAAASIDPLPPAPQPV